MEEQVRRAFVNVVIRNQDDHVKNIAYLMDRFGKWSLAPAFDIVYAYNPDGAWTSEHQMSIAEKTRDFELDDLIALGRSADLKPARTKAILRDVIDSAMAWPDHVAKAGVPDHLARGARAGFRLDFALSPTMTERAQGKRTASGK